MENQRVNLGSGVRDRAWSNRILILATAGILFLTLYPFRFEFHTPSGIANPFLLGKSLKIGGLYDGFLNVLLFAPFGFGLAEKLRERGKSRLFASVVVLVAGACLSYGIEFSQIYIPERDSGWEDVFTNSFGAVVGFLLFDVFGARILPALSACERALGVLLSGWRVALVLLLYFGFWFAASVPLQRQSRLSNWSPDALFVIGNDASGRNPWVGQIRLVQIWDRPISNDEAKQMFVAVGNDRTAAGLRASYDFSSAAPLRDQMNFLPDLEWTPKLPANLDTSALLLDGASWLSSKSPVPELVQSLRTSNQFAIRVICTPERTNGEDARILSISLASGFADLNIRQEGPALVFSFRNGISAKKSQLALHIPEVFKTGETRDILYSYDGSTLSLSIDGKLQPTRYKLGPGATLATLVDHRVKSAELLGYNDIYYALIFFPSGVLLGIAARQLPANRLAWYATLGVVIAIVPLLLELVLIRVSGRGFSPANAVLSIALVVAAGLWINADREVITTAP